MTDAFYVLAFWPLVVALALALVAAYVMAGKAQRATHGWDGARREAARLDLELSITTDHRDALIRQREEMNR